jgi:endonuclease/exonuclease/phosphatase family metal-dependent hydrolase
MDFKNISFYVNFSHIHKDAWVSPNLRTENQIDHIAISRLFRKSLPDVCTKREADIGSDHHPDEA